MTKCTRLTGSAGALFACLALAALAANEAAARDYTRSCHTNFSIIPSSPRGQTWSFRFEGRGTVGYYNPNEARRRARRNIDECLDAAWANPGQRPSQCTEGSGVYGYTASGLTLAMAQNICRLNPGHQTITVNGHATFTGDTGCLDNNSWNREIGRDRVVTCPGRETERNVNRPGMDYLILQLDGVDPCRTACINDTRCRAWSYVRSRFRGGRHRCFLKSGIPAPQVDSWCTSGVPERLH